MSKPTSNRRTLVSRVALVTLAVLLSLLLMEVALRLVTPLQRFANPLYAFHDPDPIVGWRGKPDVHARFATGDFDCDVRHGTDGMRAHESPPPAKDAPVWLFLGDSFTWGWGVGQGEPFTDVLQTTIGPSVSVKNAGLSGSGTVQQMLILKQQLAQGLKPKKVIVVFCPNDFTDCVEQRTDRPFMIRVSDEMTVTNCPVEGGGLQSGIGRTISSYSRLISTIRFAVNRTKARSRQGRDDYSPPPLSRDEIDAARECLSQMVDACKEAGAELTVVYTSMREDMMPGPDAERRIALRTMCGDLGIPFIDPTETLRAKCNFEPGVFFFANDNHWTKDGHRVVAELIAQSLSKP